MVKPEPVAVTRTSLGLWIRMPERKVRPLADLLAMRGNLGGLVHVNQVRGTLKVALLQSRSDRREMNDVAPSATDFPANERPANLEITQTDEVDVEVVGFGLLA